MFLRFLRLTLSKTSQLPTAPSTGLRLGPWLPSMLSFRRHSSSVCVSSVGQTRVRARSCSSDSELWTPKEHSWSCASASLQLDTMEAFTQRCWLWHSDAMGQSQRCDGGGWCEVHGKEKGWLQCNYQPVRCLIRILRSILCHVLYKSLKLHHQSPPERTWCFI